MRFGMVQGINNVQQLQALQATNFGQSNVSLLNQNASGDSFNGKTLLTIAGIAGAIIFRKNIAGFVAKHFPKVATWCSQHVAKPVADFIKAHESNGAIKLLGKARAGFLSLENRGRVFFGGLLGKLKSKTVASAETITVSAADTASKYTVAKPNTDFLATVNSDLSKIIDGPNF